MEITLKPTEDFKDEFKADIEKSTCEICFKHKSQYTCPKCNILYCSLNCYRNQIKHLSCSEHFYQDQVINELKSCQISDIEEKNKLAEILKREKEAMEDDQFSHNSDCILNPSATENINKIDDQELLKAYKNEALKWSPWWLDDKLRKLLLKEINKTDSNAPTTNFNKNLVKNAQIVNVSNASNLIYNEILKLSYLYFFVGYIYQLNRDSTIEISLNDEITFSLLQMNRQLTGSKLTDFRNSIDLIIKTLSTCSEENFFLKKNINQTFLISLLNDLILMIKSPNILLHMLSNLYNIFQASSSKKIHELEKENEIENESPINFFHYNKQVDEKKSSTLPKKSRVEIISKSFTSRNQHSPNAENKLNQPEIDIKTTMKDSRLFLKKLEYYFKWMSLDENYSQCMLVSKKYSSEILSLKESLIKEQRDLEENETFFDKNEKIFRKKHQNLIKNDKLIEEI